MLVLFFLMQVPAKKWNFFAHSAMSNAPNVHQMLDSFLEICWTFLIAQNISSGYQPITRQNMSCYNYQATKHLQHKNVNITKLPNHNNTKHTIVIRLLNHCNTNQEIVTMFQNQYNTIIKNVYL